MTKIDARYATLSSTYSWWRWPARHTIDGDLNTICASRWQTNAWLSIEVPEGSQVDYVAVYNRADHRRYAEWLNPFEVWVSDVAGDTASARAIKCAGPVSAPLTIGQVTPFIASCPVAVGTFVTLKLVGPARYLTVLELEAYTSKRQTRSSSSGVAARSAKGGVAATEEMNTTRPLPIAADSTYYNDAAARAEPESLAATPTALDVEVAPSTSAWLTLALVGMALAFTVLLAYTLRLRRDLSRVRLRKTAPGVSPHQSTKTVAVELAPRV